VLGSPSGRARSRRSSASSVSALRGS